MLSLYQQLLRLYPASFREQFGEEMTSVFRETLADAGQRGAIAAGILCMRETAGILSGAARERLRSFGGDHVRLVFLRRLTMHAEFRFPKATAVLMTIILAGVVVAIEKGEAIQASLPHVNPAVGPIQPVHSTLLPGVVLGLATFYAAGLIGWVILFAMHHSGVDRLAETPTRPR
jgi:hypothetical protein